MPSYYCKSYSFTFLLYLYEPSVSSGSAGNPNKPQIALSESDGVAISSDRGDGILLETGRSATSVKLSISDKLSLPLSFYESGTAAGRRGGPRRVLRRPAAPYKTRYVGPYNPPRRPIVSKVISLKI